MESFPIGILSPQELKEFIYSSYKSFYNHEILPLRKLDEKFYVMEEFYGPTASFKDLALQLFPKFYLHSIKEKQIKSVILVATSGDTGSAVLSGFSSSNIPIFVLYPKGKVR